MSEVAVDAGAGNDTSRDAGAASCTPSGLTVSRTSVPVTGQLDLTRASWPIRAGRNRVSQAHQV
jgi:hypothetical protein